MIPGKLFLQSPWTHVGEAFITHVGKFIGNGDIAQKD